MSDCPVCGAAVDIEWVFSDEQCHACETPLATLIAERTAEGAE